MRKAGGDARSALATLELSWQTAVAEGAPLEARHVADAARKRPLRYDRDGDQHYDIISAFIKSMRGGDPDAAAARRGVARRDVDAHSSVGAPAPKPGRGLPASVTLRTLGVRGNGVDVFQFGVRSSRHLSRSRRTRARLRAMGD